MPLDITIFNAIAPDLSGTDIATLNTLYDLAEQSVNDDVWGDAAEHAKALLVAHMVAMSARGSSSGPIQSERVGDLSRTYAVSSTTDQSDDSLSETAYGREFLRIRRQNTISPFIATC